MVRSRVVTLQNFVREGEAVSYALLGLGFVVSVLIAAAVLSPVWLGPLAFDETADVADGRDHQ